jgi:hypothetical protein
MQKAFLDFDVDPEMMYSFIKSHSQELFLYLNLKLNSEQVFKIFEGRREWDKLSNVIVTLGKLHQKTRDSRVSL